MTLSLQNFRAQVLSGTAKTCGVLCARDVLLAKSEIGESDVPIFTNENVLRLEISVKNI